MTAPVPDRKPNVPALAPGSDCCDCCDGVEAETPQALFNRSGLSSINYRVGDYARFRASLHAALSSSAFAKLSPLHTRDDDDFTIGLIDAFACSADVLAFYQERLANESYLRTSVERISLQEMGKLVGYRLRPGVAAETWLAFALDKPPTPPAALAPEPGNFVTGIPASLKLDVGTKVQSVPGPDEKPQTFELVEALADARPAWNAMLPWQDEAYIPAHGDEEAWLDGVATNLKAGDALLFVGQDFLDGTDKVSWDFCLLTGVEPDNDNKRTRVTWASGLSASQPATGPAKNLSVFAMRKRSAVFGNNAPVWRSMDDTFRTGYVAVFGGTITDPQWPQFTISPNAADADGGSVDLDQVQSELVPDVTGDAKRRSFAVLAKAGVRPLAKASVWQDGKADVWHADKFLFSAPARNIYLITGTSDTSRAEFALSGKVTRLALSGAGLDTEFFKYVRETSVYAKSELMPLSNRPVTASVGGDRIPVNAGADGLLPGRRLLIRGSRASDTQAVVVQATLVAAHAVDGARSELEISPPLADALTRASVVVHGNVAPASHGETLTQILGAGDASTSFQRFELKQLPLTYRAASNEIGATAALTVRVNDIAWTEQPTLFGAGPVDRAFTLQTDEQTRMFVAFGDGMRGGRLPSGVNNVRAVYRKGLGIDGNVAADSLTQLMSRPLGLKSVSNPLAAQGGTDPEPASAARGTIPLTTRTLGRAVSVLDYEDFARAFAGIAKAQAQVLQVRGGVTIAITLAAPQGAPLTEASPVWQNLLAALKSSGDPHVAVTLLSQQPSTFQVGLKVKRDPAYEADAVLAAVEAALRRHFSFDARDLGRPVQQSDVIAAAQAVEGVIAVDLTRLYGGTRPLQQTGPSLQVRLLASRMRVEAGVAMASELLTLDPKAPFDLLEEMA
jgi:hypothetical protein